MPAARRSTYRVKAVVAALDILEVYLTSEQPALGVTEISHRAGLDKSRAYRILRTLLERGYVEVTEERIYRLSLKFFELGEFVKKQMDLPKVAEAPMKALARKSGDTVLLNVRNGPEAVYIDEFHGGHPIQVTDRVRRRSSLHAGASPRILLAFAPEAEREAILRDISLEAYTPHTINNMGTLLESLERIRTDGFAFNQEELDVGVSAVAAPVRDHTEAVVAAISLVAPSDRLAMPRRAQLVGWVVDCAGEISRNLGYMGG